MTANRAILDVAVLAELVRSAQPPTLLDVRWTLAKDGRAAYTAGHLPGAVFADLDVDLCGQPGAGGRHPLPDPAELEAALRRLGVRAGHPVVVYDAGGSNPTGAAARAWWTLRWAGVDDVRVLDGGYAAWVAAGLPVTTEEPVPAAGDVIVTPGHMPVWTEVEAADPRNTLIDARVAARFRGDAEPVDPVAGHIPGAVNVPAARTVTPEGLLKPLGISGDRIGAYCGSGVTAAQIVLALYAEGLDPALYVGSWSHWITDPARAVATGESS
ncbi:sulfurtransferase [Dactylosporangium fulvum]|uniref:Sulfurtransferase n=1 Tax=Dactylosporangium fulvum TaxID=53359 RepID=A0ABY5W4F5_9ACTN|nr:sulfurtransferase [Dactylosporangium fulvum]UWP84270.1 sulfurtransferase [Dactylosporangium fulvum]